jgi:hypothetical protein
MGLSKRWSWNEGELVQFGLGLYGRIGTRTIATKETLY